MNLYLQQGKKVHSDPLKWLVSLAIVNLETTVRLDSCLCHCQLIIIVISEMP